MKVLSPALQALFSADIPFEQFDLYRITLQSGLVLRYANCPFDVMVGGQLFLCSRSPGGVSIDEEGDTGPRASWTDDLTVGTWSVNVMLRDGDLIGDQPWGSSVRAGILDEATFRVDRGYVSSWPNPPTLQIVPAIGKINKIFFGRIAEIDFGRSVVTIQANDPRELLDIDMPRNLYSASCRFALFGPGCTLDKTPFAINSTVLSVIANQTINTSAVKPDDWFALGEVLFVTGKNAGLRSSIRSFTTVGGGICELISPMPFTITAGDQITLYPGCDKTQQTCNDKFGNLLNYGGFNYIPAPETSI